MDKYESESLVKACFQEIQPLKCEWRASKFEF